MKPYILASFTLAVFFMLSAAAASAENIAFQPSSATINNGATKDIQVTLDSIPRGLSGYIATVSLSGTGAGEITAISFPSWAGLHNATSLPSNSVKISAVDIDRNVQSGATNVLLGTITVKGTGAGDLTVNVAVQQMDADDGEMLNATVTPGHLTISGSQGTATPTATATTTPTATAKPSGNPTATATVTASPSGNPTATTTVTASPSGTPTATASGTPTAAPSATQAAAPGVLMTLLSLFAVMGLATVMKMKNK